MDTNAPITPTPMFTASLKARFWSTCGRGNDRTRQAIALRNQGLTYQEIANRLGYGHRMSAYAAVNDSVIARGMARNRDANALYQSHSTTNGPNRQNPLSAECNDRTDEMEAA
jgi:hypothetical protein